VKQLGVVAQVKRAAQRRNLLATLIGCLLGGFVPLAIYVVSHAAAFTFTSGPAALVLGGLCYSAQTVYQWARLAFDNALKSVGFCVLLEGVMCTTHVHWLALLSLVYLIVINGVATGCNLSLGVQKR
jgi:hypothetical protein